MSGDLLKRLEAVTARLEAYATGLKPRGGGESKDGDSAAVSAYDAYYSGTVQTFVDNARKVKETTPIADWTEQAWKHLRNVIAASGKCKKPSGDALNKFIAPIAEVLGTAESKVDNRSAFSSHQRAFAEGVQSLQWIVQPGSSKAVVQGAQEAADYHLIKILTLAKNKAGEEQQNLRNFANGFKDILVKMAEYCAEFHKLGLDWNPKGGDVSSFSAGAPSSGNNNAGAAEEEGGAPPPPGPPPSEDELRGGMEVRQTTDKPGMGAVFDALNKGEAVTSGLKKVTADMKAKNMKDKPVLQPKETKKAGGAKKFQATEEKKPPKLELSKGTWFCENYEDQQVEIPNVEIKQCVYISKCRGCVITIPDKCKSIAVDSCFKTTVTFKSVVSAFEVFNSNRVICDVQEFVPSVAIDKSQGCQVHLSRAAMKESPQIITSMISETNVQVPGAKDEDDPIEIPVPEQYCTKIRQGGKAPTLETLPVSHSE
jgi:adenylyl cyclase-associated protein